MTTTAETPAETTPANTTPAETAPARRGTRVPARVQIMGWMMLVLVVVLLSIVLIARQFLHAEAGAKIATDLEHEGHKFITAAQRARGPAVDDPDALFRGYLSGQYPDRDEALVGAWDPGTGLRSLSQEQRADIARAVRDPAVLARAVSAPGNSGEMTTAAGPMHWVRVRARSPHGPPAWFVAARFTAGSAAQTRDTVRTLLVVSGFGVVLAACASWLVAGRVLAPVRAVRRTAAEISEHDLTRRIPVRGRDDIAALADQFNAMLDRLEEAFATQRQFVDDAGHELRTPITIVRGHLELLGDDPAERAETVRLCTDELDRMARIVEDLLVLAKAERPDFVAPDEVSLTELTSDIEAKVGSLAPRRWMVEHLGEGRVRLDAQRVTQAVVQLAQNAVQHTEEDSPILLGSKLAQGRVLLWVTDRGPGLDPATAEAVFDRFARGPGSGAGGAGLGLAIARAIADAHHGQVRVASEPGEGATFTLDLPAVGVREEALV